MHSLKSISVLTLYYSYIKCNCCGILGEIRDLFLQLPMNLQEFKIKSNNINRGVKTMHIRVILRKII